MGTVTVDGEWCATLSEKEEPNLARRYCTVHYPRVYAVDASRVLGGCCRSGVALVVVVDGFPLGGCLTLTRPCDLRLRFEYTRRPLLGAKVGDENDTTKTAESRLRSSFLHLSALS